MKFRLIALALAALASPVLATTTATISTSNFGFTIKDLNSADGVTAALTWDTSWYLYGGSSFSQQTGYAVVNYSWGNSLEPKWGLQADNWSNARAPDTSLAGNVVGGTGSYSIQLDGSGAPATSVQLTIGAGEYASASAQFSRGFWLSAGTQVSFSVLADRFLSGSEYLGGWTPPAGINSYPNHTWASSSLGMSVGSQSTNLYLYGGNGFNHSQGAFENVGEADQLKLIVRNTTTTDQYYLLNMYSQVNVNEHLDPAAAVPEPSSYALMTLGLSAVGAAARRRKA
jgi:hypothetical protein